MTRILIVDDNEQNLYMLEVLLKGHRYQVVSAGNGAEALEIARRTPPDMVITDILMPVMDGFSLCREWKADEQLQEIPFVFYTATYTDPQDEEFASSLGAERFIVKPMEPEVFVEVLRGVITEHETGQLVAPREPVEEEAVYLREYNETLIRKLESKMLQLEEANRALQQEITERRQTEEALQESEERFRAIFEQAADSILLINPETGELVEFNDKTHENLGYTREEFEQLTLADIDVIESAADVSQRIEKILAEETDFFETKHRTKDDEIRNVLVSSRTISIRGRHFIMSIWNDITGRVRTEEEIHRRNRELALLNQVIAASAADLEPKIILEIACQEMASTFDVSQAAVALLNEERTEVLPVAESPGKVRPSLLDVMSSPENYPLVQYLLSHKTPLVVGDIQSDTRLAAIHHQLEQRDTVSLLVSPLIIKDEVVGILGLDSSEPDRFSEEDVNLVVSVADEVAGALARTRLDEERRRLSAGVEQTAESVLITDTEGCTLYVNPAFERITGYARDEVIGRRLNFLKSGKQDSEFYRELWETITAGEVWHGRFVNKKKDGTFYTDEATITPVLDESGAIVNYVSVQRDVTRELQMEEQYRQAQKMEAVGRLTAGIAHDFNNLLTAINGFAELMQHELKPEARYQKYIDNILHSGRLAADLVRQLLVFSRRQVVEPRVLDLNTAVTNMEKLLRPIIGEDIRLKIILAADLWPIEADPAQIEQIIVNLAVNARDAMPQGGRLTIETTNTILDESYVAHHFETKPGEYTLLTISDTGVGMSAEVKAHLFEPFFTTKEAGKGTGLGLATIYGIVKQNEGNIWVYSEEGQGTTFKVYLPRAAEAVERLPRPDEVEDLSQGEETILLVEDDTMVRTLEIEVLRHQGYTVLEATDGEQALRLAETHSGDIHLLLTDVVMPQMSGKELADRLGAIRPDTKVLFTSGYTDNTIAHHGVVGPGIDFLQKPFVPSALARRVQEVLDKEVPQK